MAAGSSLIGVGAMDPMLGSDPSTAGWWSHRRLAWLSGFSCKLESQLHLHWVHLNLATAPGSLQPGLGAKGKGGKNEEDRGI